MPPSPFLALALLCLVPLANQAWPWGRFGTGVAVPIEAGMLLIGRAVSGQPQIHRP